MRAIFSILIVIATLAGAGAVRADAKPGDARALAGLKVGKIVWDISKADPAMLALYLGVVRETYDDLKRQEVRPDMVLTIHGVPVKYVRKDTSDLPIDISPQIEKINAILDDLKERPGVRVEVCSVANRLLGVDNGAIRDGFDVVGNTWVSLVGYQAQGYAIIPIN